MRFKRTLALLLCTALLLPVLVTPSDALETYTIKLNETLQLHLAKNLTVTSAEWHSSDARIVRVVSSSLLGCTVQGVDNSAGNNALITCTYKYLLAGRIFTAYENYRIYVLPQSGGSGGGSIGLFADPNTVTLDLAGDRRQDIILRVNGNLPNSVGFNAELSTGGVISYYYYGELLNRELPVTLCGERVGREYLRFTLYHYVAPEDVPLAHVTITVQVTCSHRYGKYEVVEPAAEVAPGVYNQICECCGDVQPVEIPAGLGAKAPVIFRQPADGRYRLQDTPKSLTAGAFVYDGGELRIDWYRNDRNSTEGGTYVGSGDAYTPPTDAAGTSYYYAVAVNTKSGSGGETTASTASETAAVTVVTPEADFEYSIYKGSVTIKKYNGADEHVVVPDEIEGCSVKEIAWSAFTGNKTIRTIQLPSSLTTIGNSAFASSTLTEVKLPPSLVSIGSSAFASTNLTEIELPPKITSINESCFMRCVNLRRVVLGENLKTIGRNAFCDCSRLGEIVIPASVTTIEEYAFRRCPSLTSVRFCNPTDKYTIGKKAFGDCKDLSSFYFCGDRSSISTDAFANDNLTLYTPSGSSTWTYDNVDIFSHFNTGAIVRWGTFRPLEYAAVTLEEGDSAHGGETPSVSVSYRGTALAEGTDYTLSREDGPQAGTVSVLLTGKGEYSGSVRKIFHRTYTLEVVNGTGGGRYTAGEQVPIAAEAVPEGKVFDRWTASGGSLAAETEAGTVFTMPAADAVVTAAFKDAPVVTAVLSGDQKTVQVTGLSQPLPGDAVIFAARYEGERLLRAFSGRLSDGGQISFDEGLRESDVLFLLAPDSLAPLWKKLSLESSGR